MTRALVPFGRGLDDRRGEKRPALPTLDRYAGILGPLSYRRKSRPGDDLTEGATIPRRDLLRVRDELDEALRPITPDRLARLIEILVGIFPPSNRSDPEAYTALMMADLAEFPEWLIEQAVRQSFRQLKFLPGSREMLELIEPELRPLYWQQERVRLMLTDHAALVRRHEETLERERKHKAWERRQRIEVEEAALDKARTKLKAHRECLAHKREWRIPAWRQQIQAEVAELEDEVTYRTGLVDRLKADKATAEEWEYGYGARWRAMDRRKSA